jgi:hypothetical protein
MISMLRQYDDGSIDQAVDDTASRIIKPPEAPPGSGPAIVRKATLRNLPSTVNTLVRNRMTSREVLHLATQHLQADPAAITPRQYNTVALNLDIFRTLERTSPNILHHYCRHIAPHQEPRRYPHPRDLVQQVRAHTGLSTPAQWRYFCRLWSSSTSAAAQQQGIRLTEAMQLLERVNRPNAPDQLLTNIALRRRSHQDYSDIHWEQGDPQQALVHLLNQFAAPRGAFPHHRDLDHVQDTLEHHLRTNQPWGPGSWENLLARADRWHRNLQDRQADPQAERAAWDSLVHETVHQETVIRPVTTGRELQHTANIMQNCLATYWQRCLQGRSRIFTIHQAHDQSQHPGYPPTLLAAVELTDRNGSWQIGQMEGPRRGPLPDQALMAAQHLQGLYQEAHERQQEGHGKPETREGQPVPQQVAA